MAISMTERAVKSQIANVKDFRINLQFTTAFFNVCNFKLKIDCWIMI